MGDSAMRTSFFAPPLCSIGMSIPSNNQAKTQVGVCNANKQLLHGGQESSRLLGDEAFEINSLDDLPALLKRAAFSLSNSLVKNGNYTQQPPLDSNTQIVDSEFPRLIVGKVTIPNPLPQEDGSHHAILRIIGEGLIIPVYTRQEGNSITTTVIDQYSQSALFQLEFRNTGNEQWTLASNIIPENIVIPSKPDLQTLNFAIATSWLGFATLIGKHRETRKESKNANRTQGHGQDCFYHDFICTLPAQSVVRAIFGDKADLFADGGTTIKLWLPCSGTISINVLDCCKSHDINLWCSTSRPETILADMQVVACICAEVALQGIKKIKPLCKIFGIDQFLLAWTIVKGFEAGIRGALVAHFFHKDNLVDYSGEHQDSCLCGGTRPTAKCTEPCRDMCKDVGKKADCYDCKWKCVYDPITGKTIDVVPDTSPSLPCCPGTDFDLTLKQPEPRNGCFDEKKVAIAKCPGKPCNQCFWRCEYERDQLVWKKINTMRFKGVECCKPEPALPKIPCKKEGQSIMS